MMGRASVGRAEGGGGAVHVRCLSHPLALQLCGGDWNDMSMEVKCTVNAGDLDDNGVLLVTVGAELDGNGDGPTDESFGISSLKTRRVCSCNPDYGGSTCEIYCGEVRAGRSRSSSGGVCGGIRPPLSHTVVPRVAVARRTSMHTITARGRADASPREVWAPATRPAPVCEM